LSIKNKKQFIVETLAGKYRDKVRPAGDMDAAKKSAMLKVQK